MKQFFTIALILSATFLSAQIVTFEEFNLTPETYLDGSDGSGGFTSEGIFLPNSYYDDGNYMYWESGWVISNTTDVTSMTQANESSAITGEGADGSSQYAVATAGFGEAIMNFTDLNNENSVTSLSITNSTLAYQTILNGGPFGQKVFGGLTGDDPDFFLLTIKGFKDGVLTTNSVEFYLADYRFTDNSQDYVVEDWTEVDLSSLGSIDSLLFGLTSSDNNAFGMLTPGYFCIDNVSVSSISSAKDVITNSDFSVSPNPTNSFFRMENIANGTTCSIFDMNGRLMRSHIVNENERIDVSAFTSGTYVVKTIGDKGVGTKLLIVE